MNELDMIFQRSAQTAELTNKAKKKSKKQDHDDWFDFEYQNIRKHNRQI